MQRLISETEAIPKERAKLFVNNYHHIKNKDTYAAPMQILITEGEGKILRNKIEIYKKLIEEICPNYTVYGLNTSNQIIDDENTIGGTHLFLSYCTNC